jgi:hypothetical protein
MVGTDALGRTDAGMSDTPHLELVRAPVVPSNRALDQWLSILEEEIAATNKRIDSLVEKLDAILLAVQGRS